MVCKYRSLGFSTVLSYIVDMHHRTLPQTNKIHPAKEMEKGNVPFENTLHPIYLTQRRTPWQLPQPVRLAGVILICVCVHNKKLISKGHSLCDRQQAQRPLSRGNVWCVGESETRASPSPRQSGSPSYPIVSADKKVNHQSVT